KFCASSRHLRITYALTARRVRVLIQGPLDAYAGNGRMLACESQKLLSVVRFNLRKRTMPEVDVSKKEKNYFTDVPQQTPGFFLKGSGNLDWGMKHRLSH